MGTHRIVLISYDKRLVTMWLPLFFLPITLFLVTLVGCKGEREMPDGRASQRAVLVVLAGDNSLSDEVAWRLRALKEGWSEELGPLFVLADSQRQAEPILYQVTSDASGRVQYKTIATFPSWENSASGELWERVFATLRACLHPKASLGLVVFSHGSGWLPEGALSHPRSFLEDKGRTISLEDFVEALPAEGLEFVLFDMCFTAGVEVAYALREKVSYVVVSSAEMLSPGFVSLYRSHLSLLYGKLPSSLVQWTELHAQEVEGKEGMYQSGTLSVLHLSSMEKLACWVGRHDRGRGQEGVTHFDRARSIPLFYDLGTYLQVQCDDEEERRELSQLLHSIVLYKWHTPYFMGRPLPAHSGMSMYLPSPDYPYLNDAYLCTAWNHAVQRYKGYSH